jgi:K+/H+ antiporter YhaU regulatory subunit KhtT
MNPRVLSGLDARHHRPKFIARAVATLASIVILGGAIRVAWGVHPLAVPNTWLLAPVLGVIALVGWLAWRRLERVYAGMERTLNELMGADEDAPEDDRNRVLRERLPFGMDAEEYRVRNYTRAAYASLKQISLRVKTGANILTVERGGSIVHNPPGEWLLLPNDRLLLVGTREQLQRAEAFLNEATMEDAEPVVTRAVALPASSPAVGRTLGELDLPGSTGARVGYVETRDGRVLAASDRVTPEAGDRIVVYGPESSIDRVHEKLKVKSFSPPRPGRGPSG